MGDFLHCYGGSLALPLSTGGSFGAGTLRRQKQVHIYLDGDELSRVVLQARHSGRGVVGGPERNVAMILTMALAGLRVSELVALNRDDLEDHWVWVNHGKGDKERRVPIHPDLRRALDRHIAMHPAPANSALFQSRQGGRISVRTVRTLVVQTSKAAGIHKIRDGKEKNVSPHKLRHTAGTLLAQADVPTHKIMDILGHESEATSHIYMAEVAGPSDIAGIWGEGSLLDRLREELST